MKKIAFVCVCVCTRAHICLYVCVYAHAHICLYVCVLVKQQLEE